MEPLQLLGAGNPQCSLSCVHVAPVSASVFTFSLCRLHSSDGAGTSLPPPPWPYMGPQAFPGAWAMASWLNILSFPLRENTDQLWSAPVQGGAPSLCLSSSCAVMGLLQHGVLAALHSRLPDLTSVQHPSSLTQGLTQQQLTPVGHVCAVRGRLYTCLSEQDRA